MPASTWRHREEEGGASASEGQGQGQGQQEGSPQLEQQPSLSLSLSHSHSHRHRHGPEHDRERILEEKGPEEGTVPRRLRPFYVHEWLDVRDTQDTWLEAQVTQLDPPEANPADEHIESIYNAQQQPDGDMPMLHEVGAAQRSAASSSSSSSSPVPPLPPPSLLQLPPQRRIRVHYKGYHARYDEWLDVSSEHSSDMRSRIALLHTHTTPMHARCSPPPFTRIGDRIDCKDTVGVWHSARVIGYSAGRRQVLVEYAVGPGQWDEWIDEESYRLQREGSFKQPAVMQIVARGGEPRITRAHAHAKAAAAAAAAGSPSSGASHSAAVSAASLAHFQATSANEMRFRQLLKNKLGSDIVDQKEDGNCLFRSVSHQVYGSPRHHELVRAGCMAYVEAERDFFAPFIAGETFEQYIERMKLDGQWGDNVELQAMSEIYERPIEIYAYSHIPLKTFLSASSSSGSGAGTAAAPAAAAAPGSRPPAPPIRLSYHFASHYNSVTHPERHRETCTSLPPGRMEAQALERVANMRRMEQAQREAVAASAAASSASASASPSSLSHCRSLFSSSQHELAAYPSGFDESVAASLSELDGVFEREVARAQQESLREADDAQMMQAAVEQSEREDIDKYIAEEAAAAAAVEHQRTGAAAATAAQAASAAAAASPLPSSAPGQAHASAKPTVEDEVLQRALAASLATAPHAAGAAAGTGVAAAADEDAQLAAAMRASRGDAGAFSSGGLEDATLQAVLRASAASAPQAASPLPPPVQACMELGFPLEQCVAAFHVCSDAQQQGHAGDAAHSEHEMMVQRMMEYLCNA